MKPLLLALTLIACGQSEPANPPDSTTISITAPSLAETVARVEQVGNFKVTWGEYQAFELAAPSSLARYGKNFVGVCVLPTVYVPHRRKLLIDAYFWSKVSPAVRMWLVAHELGHCEFNLDHDKSVLMKEFVPLNITEQEVESAIRERLR